MIKYKNIRRKHSFTVDFGELIDIKSFQISSVSRIRNYFGRWDNITISMYDITSDIYDLDLEKNIFKLKDFLKENTYKIKINDIDSAGYPIDGWEIEIKDILYIDYGFRNYDNDDIQTINILIEPKNITRIK